MEQLLMSKYGFLTTDNEIKVEITIVTWLQAVVDVYGSFLESFNSLQNSSSSLKLSLSVWN